MGRTIGVIGAGGWGTALAKLLCDKGMDVVLWCRSEESYRQILQDRENRLYLPGILLPETIKATRSLREAVSEKEILVCALPSHGVRETLGPALSSMSSRTVIVCGTKGIEEGTLMTMGEVLADTSSDFHPTAFLSGPTFASEVARGLPAAVTAASRDEAVAREVQDALSTERFRVYTSPDVIGVQLGGAIKNVIAIAAGISDGLGLGLNSRAALITRGLAEMTRLAVASGADAPTLSGLAGLGDLVLTCTGDLSRNRKVGVRIGRGENLKEIVEGTRMVAEGIRNTRSIYLLARRAGVETPIVDQMHSVLYENKEPKMAVRDLMLRTLKPEQG
jgi:glycerol-3-phosphate dehydrogenase (NAD(P)+)